PASGEKYPLSFVILSFCKQLLYGLESGKSLFRRLLNFLPGEVQDVGPTWGSRVQLRVFDTGFLFLQYLRYRLARELVLGHGRYASLSSFARFVAASTASISAPRTPARSRACRPAIVVPPGLATMSFRVPGCSPVSSTILAAPSTVWAARAVAA